MMEFCRNGWHAAGGRLMRFCTGLDVRLRGAGLALPAMETRRLKRRVPAFLGWPGLAGVGLLLGCAASYFTTVAQAQARFDAARHTLLARQEQAHQAVRGGGSQVEQVARFYRLFPQDKSLPQSMANIFAAAEHHGIDLQQGEYKVTRTHEGSVVAFQMSFPLKGDYPQIRKYLAALLADNPTLSLQQVQFKRKKIGDATVEANINLVLYMLEQRS